MPAANKGEVLARSYELLRSLPSTGPGITVEDLEKTLARRGYEISTRSIQRDLNELSRIFPIECNDRSKPYGWRWTKGLAVHLPSLGHRLAASLGRLGDPASAEEDDRPATRWTPLEEYAENSRQTAEAVLARIQKGSLNGVLIDGKWHVLDYLADVRIPNPDRPERGRLRLAARRDGNRLTAAPTWLEMDLVYDQDAVSNCWGTLFAHGQDGTTVPEFTPVKLGTQEYEVHRSLIGDLASALLAWQVDLELGDLLAEYPPDPT